MTSRIYISLLLGWVVALGVASVLQAAPIDAGEPVNVGTKYKMESKILGESRDYLVYKPPGYDFRNDRYPVLILLDAEAHFIHTSAAVDFLAGNGRIPPMLVVGLTNTDRTRDMTPPTTSGAAPGNPGVTGGAEKFLGFIADELIPTIDRDYRTRPYRVLTGHSLGGLFAVYALINRPQVFNGYLAISPSLWWDNQTLVRSADAFLAGHKDLRADLYMTMGNEGTAMLGGAWKLSAALEEASLRELRWKFERMTDEHHGSVPYRSTYDGLQAIFDGWYVHDTVALFDQAGIAGFEQRFAAVSKRLGYSVPIPERYFSMLLQNLAQRRRDAEAEGVINKYIEVYPGSAGALFAAGRYYVLRNDQTRATEYLIKSLKLFPGNSSARSLLEKQKVDPTTIVPSYSLTSADLQEISGEYKSKADVGKLFVEDGKLFAAAGGGRCEVRAIARTQLYCVDNDVEFTLLPGRGKSIRGVKVTYADYSIERFKLK